MIDDEGKYNLKDVSGHTINIINYIHIMYLCISQCMPKFSNPISIIYLTWSLDIFFAASSKLSSRPPIEVNVGLWLYIALCTNT